MIGPGVLDVCRLIIAVGREVFEKGPRRVHVVVDGYVCKGFGAASLTVVYVGGDIARVTLEDDVVREEERTCDAFR